MATTNDGLVRTLSDDRLAEALITALDVFNIEPEEYRRIVEHGQASNPFSRIQRHFHIIQPNRDVGTHYKILLALATVSVAVSITTIVLQYRNRRAEPRGFWLFRRHYHFQNKIPYLVPHPVNIIVASTIITSISLIFYFVFALDALHLNRVGRSMRVASWFPAVWLFFFASVWLSGIGALYLTFLTPSQYTRRGSLTGVKKRLSPTLLNALCFVVPVLSYSTLLPIQIKQANAMRFSMRAMRDFNATLGQIGIAWEDGGHTISLENVNFLSEQGLKTLHVKKDWRDLWMAELALWSIWTLLATLCALPCILHLVFSTNKRIRRMAASHCSAASLAQQVNQRSDMVAHSEASLATLPYASIQSVPASTASSQTLVSSKFPTLSLLDTSDLSKTRVSPIPSPLPSAVQSPTATEFSQQPFFPNASFASLTSTPNLVSSPVSFLPQHPPSQSSSRQNLSKVRRLSSYAISPGKSQGLDEIDRSDLSDLNKRYRHILALFAFVLSVMGCLCAFAMFEAASDETVLTNSNTTNIAVLVVSYVYTISVNAWLIYNMHRLATSPSEKSHMSPYPTPRASVQSNLGSYSFNREKGSVTSQDDELDFMQALECPRITVDLSEGLHIEMDGKAPSDGRPRMSSLASSSTSGSSGSSESRPSGGRVQFVRHESNERRRSSFRAGSLDLASALNFPPPWDRDTPR